MTVTASPIGTIFTGFSLTLTCTIQLSQAVNTGISVSAMWSGPSGAQFTTSSVTVTTTRTYTSTATISSVRTSDSGDYMCTATVSSTSPFLTRSREVSGMFNVDVGTNICAIMMFV